jgi:hypothetical protein
MSKQVWIVMCCRRIQREYADHYHQTDYIAGFSTEAAAKEYASVTTADHIYGQDYANLYIEGPMPLDPT